MYFHQMTPRCGDEAVKQQRGWALSLLASFLMIFTAAAKADTVGYSLLIYGREGDTDDPVLRLTNTSTAAANITAFGFTIGDTSYNFDRYYNNLVTGDKLGGSAGVNGDFSGNNPDALDGTSRSDEVNLVFINFHPGDFYQVPLEIDLDSANGVQSDFRQVFFNNGNALNSVVTVGFSTGNILTYTLPENPTATFGPTGFTFTQAASVGNGVVVPLPGSAACGVVLFGAIFAGRSRRRGRSNARS